MTSLSSNGLSSPANTHGSPIETHIEPRPTSPANVSANRSIRGGIDLSSGPLNDLRNLSTDFRNHEQLSKERKSVVQRIAASFAALCNDAPIDPALPGSEYFLFKKNPAIEQRFAGGEPAFVRTLRYASEEDAAAKSTSEESTTPARLELDTLMNDVPGLDIVATPATLLGAGFKARTKSHTAKGARWQGLPSAVYMPAAPDPSGGQHTLQSVGLRRGGFGDIRTFGSTKAFGLNNYADVAPSLSHAEKFAFVEENSKQRIKPDPMRRRPGFSHSAEELVNDLTARQATDPKQVFRANEYFAKLEVWDTKAVEIGDKKDVAIATLIEFNVEMALLERTISSEGINGPTLTDHLRRQLAWPTDGVEKPLDLSSVEHKLSQLDERETQAYLDGVLAQLRERVTLCTYQHEETGSVLRTLAFSDFSREEILAGIKRYLDARLPVSSDQE